MTVAQRVGSIVLYLQLSPFLPLLRRSTILCLRKQEAEMSEARKISAQYLNGLAVAILATIGGAFMGKHASADIMLFAGLVSLAAHALAVWIVRT